MNSSTSDLNFINKLIKETISGEYEWEIKSLASGDVYVIHTDAFKVAFSIRETEITKTTIASGTINRNGEIISFEIKECDKEFPLAIKLLDAILNSINKNDKVDDLLIGAAHPFVGSYTQPTKPNPSF